MSTAPALLLEHVQAGYGSQRVLDLESLRIAPGQRVLVRGASGSGKSTLLSLLAGVRLPQQGRVQVVGQDLRELSAARRDRFRADHLGVIFQQFNLLPFLSVRDNITLGLRFSPVRQARLRLPLEDEVRRLMAALHLDAGLIDRSASQLSVGQQQRVAAARALIGGPEVLLADEPTSALDPAAAAAFLALMFEQCQQSGTTAVVVSHDPRLDSMFDQVVVLEALAPAGVAHD